MGEDKLKKKNLNNNFYVCKNKSRKFIRNLMENYIQGIEGIKKQIGYIP